jgi:hypothetical protein
MSSKNLNQSPLLKGIGTTKHGHNRTAANIGICKSWTDVVTIFIFSLFSFGSGRHNYIGL